VYGECRAFHDYTADIDEEKLKNEFINIVFFCRQGGQPVKFRSAKRADYLTSHLRQYMLNNFQSREVPADWLSIANYTGTPPQDPQADKWVLTNLHNPLPAWQDEDALHHWKGTQFTSLLSTCIH
jgi:hypothetical protein